MNAIMSDEERGTLDFPTGAASGRRDPVCPRDRSAGAAQARRSALHLLPVMRQGEHIPRRIHQTYSTTTLPDVFQQNQIRLRQSNPGWDYRLYDDTDADGYIGETYGPAILAYYRRINPRYGAARADLFRYLLMYREGGVYLDIKSTSTGPIGERLQPDDRYWLATWRNRVGEPHQNYGVWPDLRHLPAGEFQQWHIVTVAGHPFLRAVIGAVLNNIDRYHPCIHGVGRAGVIRVTGPVAYTRAIHPLLGRHSHRLVRGEDQLGLEYSVLAKLAHTTYFKSHYLQLTEPLVALSGVKGAVARLYTAGVNTKVRLRHAAKAALAAPLFGRPVRP